MKRFMFVMPINILTRPVGSIGVAQAGIRIVARTFFIIFLLNRTLRFRDYSVGYETNMCATVHKAKKRTREGPFSCFSIGVSGLLVATLAAWVALGTAVFII